jgi:hypothetical protein
MHESGRRLATLSLKLNIQQIMPSIFLTFTLFLTLNVAAWSLPVVSGRITDQLHKPVAGVQLKLVSEAENLNCGSVTDANGQFAIEHEKCSVCCLEVCPSKNSKLAAAWVDNISGKENRKILVELKHGFVLKGRVVHEEKGLGNVIIAVKPLDQQFQSQNFVHGGGRTKTNRDGAFCLVLTPGLKSIEVENKRYPLLVKSVKHTFSVTNDDTMPNIELPVSEVNRD